MTGPLVSVSRKLALICGTGSASHVLCSSLAAQDGWRVALASLSPRGNEFRRKSAPEGIRCVDSGPDGSVLERVGRPTVATGPEIAEVAREADAVLLSLPAFAHEPYLRALLPHLSPSAVLVLMPAYGCADLLVRQILAEELGRGGGLRRVLLMEQLPWVARIAEFGRRVCIHAHKREVRYLELKIDGVYDTSAGDVTVADVVALISRAYRGHLRPMSRDPQPSALSLTLSNPNALMHMALLFGAWRDANTCRLIRAGQPPLFYQAATTESVDCLLALDDEVMTLARLIATTTPCFGPSLAAVHSFHDWIRAAYCDRIGDASTVASCLRTNAAFAGLRVPLRRTPDDLCALDMEHRYLTEDAPHGLLPLKGVAVLAGASMPALDGILSWAQELLGVQWIAQGKLLEAAFVAPSRAPQRFGIEQLEGLSGSDRVWPATSALTALSQTARRT